MKIYRPLQVGFFHRVFEQNRRFYFIASATLGINLKTGGTLLDFNFIKDSFEVMGEAAMPDAGMPKPNGEYLVSGSFFAPGGQAVTGGEVRIKVGSKDKNLYVFGPRKWDMGTSAGHEAVLSAPIDYAHAFGGKGYEANPDGIGYRDGRLPQVEDPRKLVTSPGETPEPAGLAPLGPSLPQRRRYQGTYDDAYKQKCFPGYPEDFSWRYFLCAPRDQWIDGYFRGDESYEILNMHPELPVISGGLPPFYPRCFIKRESSGGCPEFVELEMNLDTLWFFPEKLMALTIWRKGIEVEDDEAEKISHVLLGYEDKSRERRTYDHYLKALELRIKSDDSMLDNLVTGDLIPAEHKTALQLLQEMSQEGGEESELEKNISAKAEGIEKFANEKIQEAMDRAQKDMDSVELPEDAQKYVPDGTSMDLQKTLAEYTGPAKPDADVEALNLKMESILPGITGGDASKIDLREFSFDKIDELMGVVEEFSAKKEKDALDLAKSEIEKAKKQIKEQLAEHEEAMSGASDEDGERLEAALASLDDLDVEKRSPSPLPRLDAEEAMSQLSQLSPQLMEAMQHLEAAKGAGLPEDAAAEFERQIREAAGDRMKEVEESLSAAAAAFKESYVMVAHFMDDGLSPHKEPAELVTDVLLRSISRGEDVSNQDWACLDLSGENLDGVNLSGCFLEQVNFKGASLKGANLRGAIMVRADLMDADLSGANLEGANVGGVHATRAKFVGASLKSAVITRGNFTSADFAGCDFTDVEALDIAVKGAKFREAIMPDMQFIGADIVGASFVNADLTSSVFCNCAIRDTDFSGAVLKGSSFADASLDGVIFDGAEMEGACFVAADPEKKSIKGARFRGARLAKSNFQGLEMRDADFSGADLSGSNFLEADLTRANLKLAQARGALFRKARLEDARLDGINLMEGSLSKAFLVNASFRGANLFSVDFLRATITRTDFSGCNLDNTIIENWRPK